MIHHSRGPNGANTGQCGRAAALLGLIALLAVLVIGSYVLVSFWLANITVTEWRDAPAGSHLDIFFDEPAHPAWSW